MLFSPWRTSSPARPAASSRAESDVALERVLGACARALVEVQAGLDAGARAREAWTGARPVPTWYVWRDLRIRLAISLVARPRWSAGGRTGLAIGAERPGSATLSIALRRRPEAGRLQFGQPAGAPLADEHPRPTDGPDGDAVRAR